MGIKHRALFKNFSYVMIAQILSILVSVIVTLGIPRFFSSMAYSYFQLENLYCGYLWLISLGWVDGLYLKYGGCDREAVAGGRMAGQFRLLFGYLLLVGMIGSLLLTGVMRDENKKTVALLALASVLLESVTSSVINLLQATNSMFSYARLIILDRCLYFALVIGLLIFRQESFRMLIGVDIFSKLIIMGVTLYVGRDFVFAKGRVRWREGFREARQLISIGISIYLANYTGRLINGIIQFFVEQRWGIAVFGKVALTLSISNMFAKFMYAVSIVLFPQLRRMEEGQLPAVYHTLTYMVRVSLLGSFILYLPAKRLLTAWLPGYGESLRYMAILLPIALFETKVAIIINTYLKALRKEKYILLCNIMTVLVSGSLTVISVVIMGNLDGAVFSIVISLAFRCILEEYMLSRFIGIKKPGISELTLSAVFIVGNWYFAESMGTMIYLAGYVCYLIYSRKELVSVKEYIVSLRLFQGG